MTDEIFRPRSLLAAMLLAAALPLVAADMPTGKGAAQDDADVPTKGSACVMAKWQGNTLDYALVYGKKHPSIAIEEAEKQLAEKGYNDFHKHLDIRFTQATSLYPYAYVIVVKTVYKNQLGKERTSYGCGFSMRSYKEAQWRALQNLQNYSWGWTPDKGFEVVEQFQFK